MLSESDTTRAPATHDLKVWPAFFDALITGAKTFEIRKNDRGFRVGDRLILREYDPEHGRYTGSACSFIVSYLTDYAQQPGYVVMGLRP